MACVSRIGCLSPCVKSWYKIQDTKMDPLRWLFLPPWVAIDGDMSQQGFKKTDYQSIVVLIHPTFNLFEACIHRALVWFIPLRATSQPLKRSGNSLGEWDCLLANVDPWWSREDGHNCLFFQAQDVDTSVSFLIKTDARTKEEQNFWSIWWC